MARILLFDDRGDLYFQKREDLVYIRNEIVSSVNRALNLDFPNDTELMLYSLDKNNKPYKWSSFKETFESDNWLDGIDSLFLDNDFIICDYNWNTADGKYVGALDKIIATLKNSDKKIHFILYSAVLYKEAYGWYRRIMNETLPTNITIAKEVATFNEELEDMAYTLSRKMKYLFKN